MWKTKLYVFVFFSVWTQVVKEQSKHQFYAKSPAGVLSTSLTGTLWRCRVQNASGLVFWRDLTETDDILQLKPGTYYFDFKGMAQWVTLHHTCRISEVLPMHGIGECIRITPVKYCEGRLLGSQGLAGFRYLKFWTSTETKLCRGSK